MEAFASLVNNAYSDKKEGYTPDVSKTKYFLEKNVELKEQKSLKNCMLQVLIMLQNLRLKKMLLLKNC